MLKMLSFILVSLMFTGNILAHEGAVFDTQWIPARPELLTYRTVTEQGAGTYQVAITRGDSTVEIFSTLVTPGFVQTASGLMTMEMRPLRSEGRTLIRDQVQIEHEARYGSGRLSARTVIRPNDRIITKDTSFTGTVVDPVQIPFLVRMLPLTVGAQFAFTSLNPQTGELYPLTIRVVREEVVQKVECYKLLSQEMEGLTLYWIEKAGTHRAIRIEQPTKKRTSELME